MARPVLGKTKRPPQGNQVQTKAAPGKGGSVSPRVAKSIKGLRGGGTPLPKSSKAFFEPRFGQDFSKVRLHTDAKAATMADSIRAKAFTLGNDIAFAKGAYNPESKSGKKLLAHELTHTVQQSQKGPSVQRDLKAYNKSKIEMLPTGGASSSYFEMTAEGPGIRKALSGLIASGKIKEVVSTDSSVSWFAAQHHKNVQLDEIRQALKKASYAKADKLARAIYDIHGEFLYTKQELTTIAPFFSRTTPLGEKIENQTHRSMTEWEIRQARRVFGNAIKYPKVTIAEGSITAKVGAVGGYARTVGNTIYFPRGGSRSMSFMIHELTHVWQYQTTGWTYAHKAIWAQITEGYGYKESGKTVEQSLKDARAAGKKLTDYNKEQQGDILRDYYRLLQGGKDTTAWDPFINDL